MAARGASAEDGAAAGAGTGAVALLLADFFPFPALGAISTSHCL